MSKCNFSCQHYNFQFVKHSWQAFRIEAKHGWDFPPDFMYNGTDIAHHPNAQHYRQPSIVNSTNNSTVILLSSAATATITPTPLLTSNAIDLQNPPSIVNSTNNSTEISSSHSPSVITPSPIAPQISSNPCTDHEFCSWTSSFQSVLPDKTKLTTETVGMFCFVCYIVPQHYGHWIKYLRFDHMSWCCFQVVNRAWPVF